MKVLINKILKELHNKSIIKKVLNENYWDTTVEMFSNLKNNHQTVDELLGRYKSIEKSRFYSVSDLDDIMVNGQITVLDFIEGLQSNDINKEAYEEDGVIFPTTDTTDVQDIESKEGLTPQEIEHDKKQNNPPDDSDEENGVEFDYNQLKDREVTVLSNELTRKEEIEKENHTELLPLSIDYGGNKESKLYKSNLKLLQYILLKGVQSVEDLNEEEINQLEKEIDNSKFGEITDILLRNFQIIQIQQEYKDGNEPDKILYLKGREINNEPKDGSIPYEVYNNLPEKYNNEGKVDIWTWKKLMEVMDKREKVKLESIIEDRGIPRETIDRIADIAEIKTIDANKDTFDNSKRSMFKSLSLKLFSNLANNKIYSTDNKRTWENLEDDFLKGIQKVKEIEKELEELEKRKEIYLNSLTLDNRERNEKGINRYIKDTFDDPIKNLINDIEEGKVNKEDIDKFWKPYKDKWDRIEELKVGNAKSREAEKELVDLQKEYIDYREKKNPSNESIFEDLILALKEGLRDEQLSITDINTILHNTSDAIYKVFDTDRKNSTKQKKIRGVIKNILNTIKNKEKVDVFTVVDLLQKINVKKLQHDLYEKSFCECGDYFEGCGGKKGDKSSLLNKGVVEIKRYLDGDLEDSSISGASESIYNLIMDSETTKADKYDIVSKNPITLENRDIIEGGKKIEVKKYPVAAGNEYTLSEFIGLYKKTENVEKYRKKNGNHYIKYNKIIEGVVDLLNSNDGGLKDKFIGDDKLFGIFVDDYQFYNYNQIELSWSADSDQKRFSDEKRITLKFKIKENAEPTRWVKGNCNIDTPIKESKTKSTIKKLLKEEFNDLGWIENAFNSKLSKNENWILVNDIDRESISEGHEIQKYLFDLGYDWGTGDFKSLKDFCIYTIYHYGDIKDGNQIYYQDGCRSAEVRISDKDIKGGRHMIYYWSDLKPKTIKEENEFDWTDEVKPTLNVAFEEGMIKKGDVLTLSGELTDSEGRFPIQVSDFKIKIEIIRGPDSVWSDISHSFFIPLQEKYFEHLGYNEPESGASIRFANTDGNLEVLDIS